MLLHSEAEDRVWESQCRLPTTVRSRSAVSKLRALPPNAQTYCIVKYAQLNLPCLLRCAITAGISPDTRWGEHDAPVLYTAAEQGNERALEELLVGHANATLADNKGRTATHAAAAFGYAPCLRLLLDSGAQLEAKANGGFTPLHLAAASGHAECCSLLLAMGCALDARRSLDARDDLQRTPLHYASVEGDTTIMRLLLDAGADLEAKESNGRTPIIECASAGCEDAVLLLLARGANPKSADNRGNTPLMVAIMDKRSSCVQALLPESNLAISCQLGYNAFHTAVTAGDEECFEMLLPMVDVDVRTVQGFEDDVLLAAGFECTPLHLACSFGKHDMAKALLRRGAARSARDSKQKSPLHHAARHGHLSIVAALLGKPGAYKLTPDEVNAADYRGRTPLHRASIGGHLQICGKLHAGGALLDAVTRDGYTPLMLAQQKHPSNTALLDFLAGRGPAHPPGTVCDGCSRPETEVRLSSCDGCLLARYCGRACLRAAWPAHKEECRRAKAAREARNY